MWKDIPTYEGKYEVSDTGQIRSIKRNILLKPQIIKNYEQVTLNKNGYSKSYKVHQLVAMAFLGHTPCGMKLIIDHIDNDTRNNNVLNLRITTQRNNTNNKKNKSGLIGCYYHKKAKKYTSEIRLKGKRIYLGLFENEYDAHLAYQSKLKEYAEMS